MSFSLSRILWPSGAPRWLLFGGNLALLIVLLSLVTLLLPHSLVAKVKPLRLWRSFVLKNRRRLAEIWVQTPLHRFVVFLGKKCCMGRLSSQSCQPQALKCSAKGCKDGFAIFSARLPRINPFHEERYICATRRADDDAEEWKEQVFEEEDLDRRKDKSFMAYLQKLPEHAKLEVRVCAENAWGRSPWSDAAKLQTRARPVDGGFTGPLGLAASSFAEEQKSYRWTQKRGEVSFKVPIGKDWPGRNIKFKSTSNRLEILHVPTPPGAKAAAAIDEPPPEQVLLAGRYPKKVKADEVFWDIDDYEPYGRHIDVKMTKFEAMDKWNCLLEEDGNPRIDERLVKIYTQEMDGLGKGGIDIFE